MSHQNTVLPTNDKLTRTLYCRQTLLNYISFRGFWAGTWQIEWLQIWFFPACFDPPEDSFSFCQPVKTCFPPAENVIETPAVYTIAFNSQV